MDKLKFYRHQELKNKLQRLFLMLSAGVLCFALTGQAFAGCGYTNNYIGIRPLPGVWVNRVGNSSNNLLKASFKDNNDSCLYKIGPHEEGWEEHVTVVIQNVATCHVYADQYNNNRYRTTCEKRW